MKLWHFDPARVEHLRGEKKYITVNCFYKGVYVGHFRKVITDPDGKYYFEKGYPTTALQDFQHGLVPTTLADATRQLKDVDMSILDRNLKAGEVHIIDYPQFCDVDVSHLTP